MENDRFVVLTGHLSNYPLSDLVGILRHQRKSGRLLIEYPKGPATFFFQNGELIDARMNELTGLQAICVALAQPEASFNFNPLIQSPRRSIEPSLQRAVSELFGCWDESALQIEAMRWASLARSAGRPLAAFRTLAPRPDHRLWSSNARCFIVAAVLIVVGLIDCDCSDWRFQQQPGCYRAVAASSNSHCASRATCRTAKASLNQSRVPNRPERKEEKRTEGKKTEIARSRTPEQGHNRSRS